MKCPICKHGETRNSHANITLERGNMVLVIRDVPALICDNCGEVYHIETVTKKLLQQADAAAKSGVEFDIRRYLQAA